MDMKENISVFFYYKTERSQSIELVYERFIIMPPSKLNTVYKKEREYLLYFRRE